MDVARKRDRRHRVYYRGSIDRQTQSNFIFALHEPKKPDELAQTAFTGPDRLAFGLYILVLELYVLKYHSGFL